MQFRPLLLAAAALLATSAQAASYSFSGVIDAGPLAADHVPFSGSFSADTAALTGSGFETLALTDFSLNFLLTTYSWNAAATADYQDGVFLGLSYSTSGAGYTLSMTSGSMDLSDAFLHYQPTGGLESSGGYSLTAVPEPETYALMLGGLGLVGWMARRKR